MASLPVIAIFDIGKTNKKLFVFNEEYGILHEESAQFPETQDEDGDACEDLALLTRWVGDAITRLCAMPAFKVKALNFSTYGASFVHVDPEGRPVAPLYNYLKPFPEHLKKPFYDRYGGEKAFSMHTASPLLGNLNSGLQLYYLKQEKPEVYRKISASLHLPQYMSFLVTGRQYSDITSIGCHTGLWNFTDNRYHEWLYREGVISKLSPIFPSDQLINTNWKGQPLACGVGLHDSSAALIPYLSASRDPFVLISTGTWCISLNPFNHSRLNEGELQQDCLCYMQYRGRPVKASRLFAGFEHGQEIKKLGHFFNVQEDYYKTVEYNPDIVQALNKKNVGSAESRMFTLAASAFGKRELSSFDSYAEAYHRLIMDIMDQQVSSTRLVLKEGAIKQIFVDGGFGQNPIYMQLLAAAFPEMNVYAASVPQASAIGAALAVHPYWNRNAFPSGLVGLKLYGNNEPIEL